MSTTCAKTLFLCLSWGVEVGSSPDWLLTPGVSLDWLDLFFQLIVNVLLARNVHELKTDSHAVARLQLFLVPKSSAPFIVIIIIRI